jgi:hypothetical protein
MRSALFLAVAALGCGHQEEAPTYDSWPLSLYTSCYTGQPIAEGARLYLEVTGASGVLLRTWSSEAGDILCRGQHGYGPWLDDGPLGSPVIEICVPPPAEPVAVRACLSGAGEQTWTMLARKVIGELPVTDACGPTEALTTFNPTSLTFSLERSASNACPEPGSLPEVRPTLCPCARPR